MRNKEVIADHLRTTYGDANTVTIMAALDEYGELIPEGSCVYFMRRSSDGLIKIGHTGTIKNRRRMLEKQYSTPVEILATNPGADMLEQAYHAKFSDHRVAGEWFTPSQNILAEIELLGPYVPAPRKAYTRLSPSPVQGDVV